MSSDDAVSPVDGGTLPTLLCRDAGRTAHGSELSLDSDGAAHARALRLREGDDLALTDGRGRRWRGRLMRLDRRRVTCLVLEPLPVVDPWPIELWAPVGGRDRSLWLIEKATEIGVRTIRFVEWERSRSVADAGRSKGFVAKALRRAESALTQSGGSRLPEIESPAELREVLALPRGEVRLLADPAGAAPRSALRGAEAGREVVLLVGPEGGATAGEKARCAAAGFEPMRLGPRTLRFETAGVVGLACILAALEGGTRAAGAASEAASAAPVGPAEGSPGGARTR